MRKVTDKIASAFADRKSATTKNTKTDGHNVWLHGNLIARRVVGSLGELVSIEVTLAGWNTPTTRERVNGILAALGSRKRFQQKNYAAMCDGKEVGAHAWVPAF